MSVIEGIGDEVVQFFSVLFVVVIAVAAWWSTSIRENHHNIRTVLILERRRNRTSGETSPQPVTTVTNTDSAIDTGQQEASERVEAELLTEDSQNKNETQATNTLVAEGESTVDSSEADESSIAAGTIVETIDAPASEQSPKKRVTSILKEPPSDSTPTENQSARNDDQIRIRLKYLNDDQKLVDGRLQEPLGDFKRRHFSIELSTDKLVRLIFNGQVLGCDHQTLQACGLYDNCVVHCLIHTQRTAPRSPASANSSTTGQNSSPPDWNLSTLLYTCLSLVLCLVWYCRYQYAQLFTLTTTAALIGLTGIFTVSIFSLYLPDQDGIPH